VHIITLQRAGHGMPVAAARDVTALLRLSGHRNANVEGPGKRV
jgi:hypothetical protein